MTGIVLNRVPGWQAAIKKARAKQSRIRENAWKCIPWDFNGTKVRVMTVGDYLVLEHFNCPFLYRQEPELCDLAFLFWALSYDCLKWNQRRIQFGRSFFAWKYSRWVTKKFGKDVVFQEACAKVFEYIDEIFLDAPASIKNGRESGLCYLAAWFDIIQSQYHMSESEVIAMPLPQLFQRIRAIQERTGVESPQFDKIEDKLKAWVQDGISKRRFTYDDLAGGRVVFGES